MDDAGARCRDAVEISDEEFEKLITAKALAPELTKDEKEAYLNICRLNPTEKDDYEYVFTPLPSLNNSIEAANDDIELLSD